MLGRIIAVVGLLVLSNVVLADPYIEFGLGAVIDNNKYHCVSDYNNKTGVSDCSNNPLGMVAIGYEWNDFRIEAKHMSSLTEKDRGLDTVFITYRLFIR